jgi:hypothetical protein
MAEKTDVVAEFLNELIPKSMVEAAQLLASLDYPIPDKKSLLLQLEERQPVDQQGKETDAELSHPMTQLIENVAATFGPEDFGIDTPRSALEKFFARAGRIDAFLPIPWSFGPTPQPGLPPEPDLTPRLNPSFGDDPCGRAAHARWQEHLDDSAIRGLSPSRAELDEITSLEDSCRIELRQSSWFNHPCGGIGDMAYAWCRLNGRLRHQCLAVARQRVELASRFGLCSPFADLVRGWGRPFGF